MSRKKETITLSIPPGTKEKLEAIAKRLGILWGESPSISGLIAAIALLKPEVRKIVPLTSTQAAALEKAIKLLIDEGYIEQARTLLTLLLNEGNLKAPLSEALQRLLNQHQRGEAWRNVLNEYIQNQQTFYVQYRNSQGQELGYTVRYAEISFHEKRYYLNIWCEETEDIQNTDFPELIHNRCLSLDRIKDINAINKEWRHEGLDFIEVYLHFYDWMSKAYLAKPDDISDEIVGEVRQVVRKVYNDFWLIREVAGYWEKCVIVSPAKLRTQLIDKLKKLNELYGLTDLAN